jgi:exodeoxyribonuclease V alpha subunit
VAIHILARFKREIFSKPGWSVVAFERLDDHGDEPKEITCVGALGHVSEGENCQLEGEWTRHPQFGQQFRVRVANPSLPRDHAGVLGFLTRLANIGEKRAALIVDHFGADEVFDVLDRSPERLAEIRGISERGVAEVRESYALLQHKRRAIVAMKSASMTDRQIAKVLEYHEFQLRREKIVGDEATALLCERVETALRENPYQYLAIDGFGFVTVDRIAIAAGIERQGIPRTRAAIEYVLDEAAKQGHCYLPGRELTQSLHERVGIRGPSVRAAGTALKEEGRVVTREVPGGVAIYRTHIDLAEQRVADFARERATDVELVEALRAQGASEGDTTLVDDRMLNADQNLAVALALREEVRLLVVTGGPGTGKTRMVGELVTRARARALDIMLCAPTGKAARRMGEQAGMEAKTLHRLLEWSAEERSWRRDEFNPLPHQLIVVDEASMLDLELAAALVRAVPRETTVVLVGDVDQLPSIGAGQVLRDLIGSHQVPTVRFTQLYRQVAGSALAENARRFNSGQPPKVSDEIRDFFFSECSSAEDCFSESLRLICDVIPERHQVKPIRDVQVLSPQRKGVIGVEAFNGHLQQRLNPPVGVRPIDVRTPRGMLFRVGDKVRHIKNNYSLEVMNGETGVVTSIEPATSEKGRAIKRTHVDYGDRVVVYPRESALAEVVLSYCGTVHGSQGSEYPVVVLLCHSYNHHMLSRNLIYTGLTRAREAVYLVGDKKGLWRALKNTNVMQRYTQLAQRIRRA